MSRSSREIPLGRGGGVRITASSWEMSPGEESWDGTVPPSGQKREGIWEVPVLGDTIGKRGESKVNTGSPGRYHWRRRGRSQCGTVSS